MEIPDTIVDLDGESLVLEGPLTFDGTVTLDSDDGTLSGGTLVLCGDDGNGRVPESTCSGAKRPRKHAADVEITGPANDDQIAAIPAMRQRLEKAASIAEIRAVENLAQLARDFAGRVRLGRDDVDCAARLFLDARRKMGDTLQRMKERGELAQRGERQIGQRVIYTLRGLGLNAKQASRYQQEASVPPEVYEKWARQVVESRDGILTAAGLRALAPRPAEPGQRDPLPFATAASAIERLVAKCRERLDGDGRARLPEFLNALSTRCAGTPAADGEKPRQCGPDGSDTLAQSRERPPARQPEEGAVDIISPIAGHAPERFAPTGTENRRADA